MATPESHFVEHLEDVLGKVEFRQTFLNGMVSFLLFAGALHVDLSEVSKNRWPVLVLSTLGVMMSTVIVGVRLWLVTAAVAASVAILYCMAFGALISPTDPVAVLAIMRRAGAPAQIEATVAGESLLNEGVAIAMFTVWSPTPRPGAIFLLPMPQSFSWSRAAAAWGWVLSPAGSRSAPCMRSTTIGSN